MKAVVERNTREILADLEAYFAKKVSQAELLPVNPAYAAERFLSSVLGLARVKTMFGDAPEWDDRDSYIQDAVTGFLNGIRNHKT